MTDLNVRGFGVPYHAFTATSETPLDLSFLLDLTHLTLAITNKDFDGGVFLA